MGVTYIRLYASVLCFGRSNLSIRMGVTYIYDSMRVSSVSVWVVQQLGALNESKEHLHFLG
jgi:hypothetical protein